MNITRNLSSIKTVQQICVGYLAWDETYADPKPLSNVSPKKCVVTHCI